MLSFLIAKDKNFWGEMLVHEMSAPKNNVGKGTGLASSETHIGRYPRLSMTMLEVSGAKRHQSEKRDQLDFSFN